MRNAIFDYDICIQGGGVVGMLAAQLLAKAGFSVLILEKQIFQAPQQEQGWELRCSAITLASQRILASIDGWPKNHPRIQPYEGISVWETGSSSVDFTAAALGLSELGFIVENSLLHHSLSEGLQRESLVSYQAESWLASFAPLSMGWKLEVIQSGRTQQYSCRLLLGADGLKSTLRQAFGLEQKGWSYDCQAIVTHVLTALPHNNIARQCFTSLGPLAFLPLAEPCRSSVVWSLPSLRAQELLSFSLDEFSLELTKNFEYRLGPIEAVAPCRAFPLELRYAKSRVLEGLALVGEAAQIIHPMAGQGLNLGILDAWKLTQVLKNAQKNNWDFGSYRVLRQYERQAKGRLFALGFLTESLHRLYQTELPIFIEARRQGLQLLNQQDFLKNLSMEYASGFNEVIPIVL